MSGQEVPPVIVPGNSFFVKIKLGDDRDFLVTLAREGDDALYLELEKWCDKPGYHQEGSE